MWFWIARTLTALSLLCASALMVLCVRSYRHADRVSLERAHRYELESCRGTLTASTVTVWCGTGPSPGGLMPYAGRWRGQLEIDSGSLYLPMSGAFGVCLDQPAATWSFGMLRFSEVYSAVWFPHWSAAAACLVPSAIPA